MLPDLSPGAVARRLERLRVLYVAVTEEEARQLMSPPRHERPFVEAVAARLAELRALTELTAHLHGLKTR